MGWQDIYKKKMQESGLAAGDINFVDVDTFHKGKKSVGRQMSRQAACRR